MPVKLTQITFEQGDAKVLRFFASCFGVDPEFATKLVFNQPMQYIYAGFDKESMSAELFVEMSDRIRVGNILDVFEKLGATQVMIMTFPRGDQNETASDALLRVWKVGNEKGYPVTKGVCPEALFYKTKAKQEKGEKELENKQFDEKTQAAITSSLNDVKDAANESKVASLATQEKVGVISDDYLRRMEYLETENKRITLSRDQMEYKMANKTKQINQLIDDKTDLQFDNSELKKEIAVLRRENANLKALESARWIIEEERSLKRPRTDEPI
jgi:hypothetical protein